MNKPSSSPRSLKWVLVDEYPSAPIDHLKDAATVAWGVVASQFEESGEVPPNVTVVIADDIWEAAQVWNRRLGNDQDLRGGPERLNGFVAGKTLHGYLSTEAAICLNGNLLRSTEPTDLWMLGAIFTHECGHLRYGRLRDRHVGRETDAWLPWEIAELIAVIAAEEYRVETHAQVLTDLTVTVSSTDGEALKYNAVFRDQQAQAVVESFLKFADECTDAVQDYRINGGDERLASMFRLVASKSQDLTNVVLIDAAYRRRGDQATIALLAESDPENVLARALEPLVEYVRESPLFPTDKPEWLADRQELKRLGREAWTEIWASLGLEASPRGDGYHLKVSEPSLVAIA